MNNKFLIQKLIGEIMHHHSRTPPDMIAELTEQLSEAVIAAYHDWNTADAIHTAVESKAALAASFVIMRINSLNPDSAPDGDIAVAYNKLATEMRKLFTPTVFNTVGMSVSEASRSEAPHVRRFKSASEGLVGYATSLAEYASKAPSELMYLLGSKVKRVGGANQSRATVISVDSTSTTPDRTYKSNYLNYPTGIRLEDISSLAMKGAMFAHIALLVSLANSFVVLLREQYAGVDEPEHVRNVQAIISTSLLKYVLEITSQQIFGGTKVAVGLVSNTVADGGLAESDLAKQSRGLKSVEVTQAFAESRLIHLHDIYPQLYETPLGILEVGEVLGITVDYLNSEPKFDPKEVQAIVEATPDQLELLSYSAMYSMSCEYWQSTIHDIKDHLKNIEENFAVMPIDLANIRKQ